MGDFILKITMLKIGDFARAGRVSIKALRHYDATGLLRPAYVDRATRYRYYSAAQLPILNRLVIYRELGFSLHQARVLLDECCPPERLRQMLDHRRDQLTRSIQSETARLGEVLKRIDQLETGGSTYQAVIHDTQPAHVVSMRRILPGYDALDPLFGLMRRAIPASEVHGEGAIWHRCAASGASIDGEALLFLKHAAPASRRLAARKVASVFYRVESGDPFPQIYRAALETIDAGNYEILWPMREIYHAGVTEVQFPIRPLNGDSHAI